MPQNTNAIAETLGDLKKEYQELLNEKKANDNQTQAAKDKIAANERAVKQAEQDKTSAEKAIVDAQEAIEASNVKIAELTKESEKVLLYMQQMKSQNAYLEYITGASSMTDFITRVSAIEQITNSIKTTMDDIKVEIENNKKLKLELEAKKKKLEEQMVTYRNIISQQYSKMDEYDKFALGINEKIDNAKVNLNSWVESCARYAPSKGDSANLNNDCLPPNGIPGNGAWLKPLNSGRVSSTMGYRVHPVTGKPYDYHNAVDIAGNREGTPVYAAASGRVSGKIPRYSCGGNMLYIDVTVGGQRYTTYYFHLLNFNVNVGDVVTQNTIIGWVGGGSTSTSNGGYDKCTTGAHLHFGVQKGFYSNGIVRANVIVPPGFDNREGYRFYNRNDFFRG